MQDHHGASKVIVIKAWTDRLFQLLSENFGDRLWFLGLQGSHGRGEATQNSDIDVVVILDELTTSDIHLYDSILDAMPHRELACGFLAGKDEIFHWDPSDLFQFYHDTEPIQGSLDELLPLIDEVAVKRAIKIGVCNVFHGCVHNMLYDKSEEILKGLYKSASFIIQAIHFLRTGQYIRQQKELLPVVRLDERTILEAFSALKNKDDRDFNEVSEVLFLWSKKWINEL